MQKEKMHSLIGLSAFLFGSFILVLLMLGISTMPSYNGLNPLYAVCISITSIGVGFFLMLSAIEKGVVDIPRAMLPIAIIGLGCLAFIWNFSTLYHSGFLYGFFGGQTCPSDGICWAELQIPVASIILADLGAILLQTPFVKKRVHVKALATSLPQTQQQREKTSTN